MISFKLKCFVKLILFAEILLKMTLEYFEFCIHYIPAWKWNDWLVTDMHHVLQPLKAISTNRGYDSIVHNSYQIFLWFVSYAIVEQKKSKIKWFWSISRNILIEHQRQLDKFLRIFHFILQNIFDEIQAQNNLQINMISNVHFKGGISQWVLLDKLQHNPLQIGNYLRFLCILRK